MTTVTVKKPAGQSLRGKFAQNARGSLYMITEDYWVGGEIRAIVVYTGPQGGLAPGEDVKLRHDEEGSWLLPPGTIITITV